MKDRQPEIRQQQPFLPSAEPIFIPQHTRVSYGIKVKLSIRCSYVTHQIYVSSEKRNVQNMEIYLTGSSRSFSNLACHVIIMQISIVILRYLAATESSLLIIQ